jgi:uncharacterized protein
VVTPSSFRNRAYYWLKPFIPRPARIAFRSWLARRKRLDVNDRWPILPGSEQPPEGWPGWPDGKQFALVLTHDVEGPEGLNKCWPLAELEMQLGFRSSFNFIPEGDYAVPDDLRQRLISHGFEVGVHDLYHDGKLFKSRAHFHKQAPRINHYIRQWDAAGFRAGFMLRRLHWLHDLDIQYDLSTFDTDPFEPESDGMGTIFPFWVSAEPFSQPLSPTLSQTPSNRSRSGYVELPYTLPQDSTLFLLLRERHPDIWTHKLDWIAKHGGMVLLDTHPDYMSFGAGQQRPWEYPIELYRRFMEYVRSHYERAFWQALPRDVARFVQSFTYRGSEWPGLAHRVAAFDSGALRRPAIRAANGRPKIWIDLDNTPHVPFFEPIIEELRARGYPLLVTARDAFQVCDLADKKRLPYVKVGRHHGKHRLLKAAGLVYRGIQLSPTVLRERPQLAVSHGARSQLLLSNCLRIPSVLIEDYEYSIFPPMMRPTWVMAPAVIPNEALRGKNGHVRKYTGIKEDVYAWKLEPDPGIRQELGIADAVVTVRPPATEAHYHNPESEELFSAFMDRAAQTPQVRVVLLPRNQKQARFIQEHWPAWFKDGKTVIPGSAVDGLNLIWHSDLVVSGGGTMNREAAALGVPVYSIFRGTIGAVDRQLCAEGRLVLLETAQEVREKISLVKRPRKTIAEVTSKRTVHEVVDTIEEIAASCVKP